MTNNNDIFNKIKLFILFNNYNEQKTLQPMINERIKMTLSFIREMILLQCKCNKREKLASDNF